MANQNLPPLPGLKPKPGAREWVGACPECGGKDRFCVWPDEHKNFRYYCRQCGIRGDAIDYLRKYERLTYLDACHELGITPALQSRLLRARVQTFSPARQFTPREIDREKWRKAALGFEKQCLANLQSAGGQMELARRGLTPVTGAYCSIGVNFIDCWQERSVWGLPDAPGNSGRNRTEFFIPAGLVISVTENGKPASITIRRRNEFGARYRELPGSLQNSYCLFPEIAMYEVEHDERSKFAIFEEQANGIICESALDAALLWQETDRKYIIVATNGSGKPIDDESLRILRGCPRVIAIPDNDDGGEAAYRQWQEQIPGIELLNPDNGYKDIGDMWQAGKNLRLWINHDINPEVDNVLRQIDRCGASIERLSLLKICGKHAYPGYEKFRDCADDPNALVMLFRARCRQADKELALELFRKHALAICEAKGWPEPCGLWFEEDFKNHADDKAESA